MIKRKILLTISALCLLTSSVYAKKDENEKDRDYKESHKKYDDEKNHKEKHEKHKDLPKGLEKKVERDGTLPSGWKNKLYKGEKIDERVLRNGRIVDTKNYPYIKNSEVYEVEDRIFRIANDTKMIMEIFK